MSAALHLLCPSGTLEKALKYLFGLIFLLCIIGCLPTVRNISKKATVSQSQSAQYTSDIQLTELAFKLALKNSDIQFSKITVCTDKNEDGGIIITKVIVHSSHSPEAIRQALGGDEAEYAIEVVYG